ncbi:acyltransferase family protein [Cellulomonas fengjieae]|uniref:Acyltransferase n=1 Tax=Cellulomonas fengjieae TaxID=2819978 RepID=A0ABS3SDN1_9CELL|nr:acyltransferase [Cellulomonas fengjieae]MBO3083862.1 acyltransferase [Cellulomonas fengjieae]QVI64852.1 acyltransferase [Cellulomonas fengjieae]
MVTTADVRPSSSILDRATGWFGVGSWRLLLAGFVAASHLWSRMVQGPAAYAVWGFYVLSGYLMTYVLIEKYGFSAKGIRNYAFNRFLRIYPGYWIAVMIGVVVITVVTSRGIDPTALNPEFYLPQGWYWLNPLTLFPLFPHSGLPVAVSSALAIEIGAYLLMPLLAKARAAAWMTAITALLAALALGFGLDSFAVRYATLLPCLLPFAVGALLCHYRSTLLRFVAPRTSLVVWLVHAVLWWQFPYWPWTYGLYSSMVLSAWVTLSLTARRSGRADTLFGDLSYPVYLLHTAVGACFLGIWGYDRPFRFFALSMAVTLVASWLLMTFVERPLYRLKRPAARREPSADVGASDPAPDLVPSPAGTITASEADSRTS